jgi:hypothetical protein
MTHFYSSIMVICQLVVPAPPGGFAHSVATITVAPASAPLRSLTRPSMAAFLTFSQRSLRFESSWRIV